MREKGSVPAIRFAGFTDDWERRRLGEIVERVTRKNQDLVSELPLTISAQYGLIDQKEFFDKRVASKDVSGYYLIYNGEFAYNKSTSNDAPWGAIKRLDRYENGVLSTLYIVFRIKDEKVISSDFLTTYYDTNNWHKDIQAIAAEGARNHGLLNIAPNDFFQSELMLPQDIDEQQKIGNYLKSLNDLITLHQRKYSRLCNVKKSMLERMFPREGATVPEIRFAGFTDAWEQRKVKNIAPLQRGFDLPATQMKDGLYPVVMSNGIGGYHSIFKVKGPGVVTGRSGTLGKLHYIEKDYWPHNTSLWVTDFKENYPKFIYYLYQKLDLSWFGSGSGVPTLNRNDVHDAVVEIPQKSEQQKIAEFFGHLDHLITLHQHELERLQNIKKACLEKMFV